jgi:Tol biopolymer transport system component
MKHRIRSSLPALAALAYASTLAGAQDPAAARPSMAEPGISPDGAEIAFVSGGDVWTVPARGGEARLLVSHPATEQRPLYSPDGSKLAFVSTRTGNGDVYVLDLAGGELRRLTWDDGLDQLDGWSRDGRWLYFSSTTRDVAGMNDLLRVSVEGGTPMQVSADRYTNEFASAEGPDGTLAFAARGVSSAQWWRRGSSHLDQSELWLLRPGAERRYEQVTRRGAREGWPMWGPDGRTLFFVSDRGGAQNVWSVAPGAEPRQVTRFRDARVLWPSISPDGRTLVFERDFRLWRMDTATGQAAEVPVTLRGTPASPDPERRRFTEDFQELALSPDGKKVALVVRGEVFAAGAKEGGDAERVTDTPGRESQVAWAPDSRRLVYAAERGGATRLYLYDLATRAEKQLTRGDATDASPVFSPDGKWVAFARGGRELRVVDPATGEERMLARGYLDRPPFNSERGMAWSPDSRWVAFLSPLGEQPFTNVHVVPAAGGEARPVSFLGNAFANTVSWSPDGTYLLLNSWQRSENAQVVRVDLVPRPPRFREDQFRDLFREQTPPNLPGEPRVESRPDGPQPQRPVLAVATAGRDSAAAAPRPGARKPTEIVFEGIRRRTSPVPVGLDVGSQTISPDGKWLLLTATSGNQQNLYVYSLDELSREPATARQLTSTPGQKREPQFTPDSKEVYYLESGRIQVVPLETRQPRPVAVTAEMQVDFAREKMAVFEEGWTYLRDNFYDPRMHGVDWAAVRARYAPHVAGARTPDEMRRVMALMVGELNASHSGINAPPNPALVPTGRLGLRFDRGEYERSGRLRVAEVIPQSPASLAGIRAGEYLLAVDGTRIGARTSLDALLEAKVGRRVALTVAPSAEGAGREAVLRPVNTATEKALLYRSWVEANRAYVSRASGGRLGYVHLFDMNAASLDQLYLDLDAENMGREGVVIDLRNNNGGFVNAYVLDVFSRRPYMSMTIRGQPTAPARTMLGQRAFAGPTVLVVNQHSLSDAEDFTEGYRALELGRVVGEPTAGWIIYTSNVSLLDGSLLRIPFIRITGHRGDNMELAPRPVDVPVTRPVGETLTGRDSQLDTAVRELLGKLGGGRTSAEAR